jgi:hypothetical protein
VQKIYFLSVLSLLTNSVNAADVSSPFLACKDVKIVTEAEYKSIPKQDCEKCVSVTPDFDVFQFHIKSDLVEGIKEISLSEFAKKVAAKVEGNLQHNSDYASEVIDCFKKGQSSQDACSNENLKSMKGACATDLQKICSQIYTAVPALRQELALSKELQIGALGFGETDPKKRINSYLSGNVFTFTSPTPVSSKPLSTEELAKAIDQLKADEQTAKDEAKVAADTKSSGFLDKVTNVMKAMDPEIARDAKSAHEKIILEKLAAEHKEKYLKILHEDAPVLAVAGDATWKNNKPSWTNAQLVEAFTKMKATAESEKAKTIEAIKSDKLEAKRETGEALANWAMGKRDLMYYMMLTPAIEEVLSEDPSFCGVATGLVKRKDYVELQNSLALMAGTFFIPGAQERDLVEAGSIMSKLKSAGRITVSGAVNSGLLYAASDWRKIKEVKDQIYAGTDKKIQTSKKLEEVESNGRVSAVFVAIAPVAKLFSMVKMPDAKIRPTSDDAMVFKALHSKGLLDEKKPDVGLAKSYFENADQLTPAERKDFAKDLTLLFGKLNPLKANASAKEKAAFEERSQQVTRVGLAFARTGMKDPNEIAKLLNDKSWSPDSLKAVEQVLLDSRLGLQEKLKNGLTLNQARAESVEESLAKINYQKDLKDLSNAEKQNVHKMCACIDSCPHGGLTADIDWKHLDLAITNSYHVCTAH